MGGVSLDYTDFTQATLDLAPQVLTLIEEYLGRKIKQATYTELYSGNGQAFLVLRQRPVQSITALYLDDYAYWGDAPGAFDPATTLQVEGTDYALDRDQPDGSSRSGLVYRVHGYWPRPITYGPARIAPELGPRAGNIKITYTAGYADPPPDLQLAVSLTLKHVWELGDAYTKRRAVTKKGDDQRFRRGKCRWKWSCPDWGGHDHVGWVGQRAGRRGRVSSGSSSSMFTISSACSVEMSPFSRPTTMASARSPFFNFLRTNLMASRRSTASATASPVVAAFSSRA
jgi:hypothetical protein